MKTTYFIKETIYPLGSPIKEGSLCINHRPCINSSSKYSVANGDIESSDYWAPVDVEVWSKNPTARILTNKQVPNKLIIDICIGSINVKDIHSEYVHKYIFKRSADENLDLTDNEISLRKVKKWVKAKINAMNPKPKNISQTLCAELIVAYNNENKL